MSDNIQAILFKKKYWNTERAREYLKSRNYEPIKRVHKTKNYLRYRLQEPDFEAEYITRSPKKYPSVKYIVKIN